jgi:hypothetical protein
MLLNVVVAWLTLLLHIREFLASNLSPEIGYSDLVFLWFSSVPPGKCWDSTLRVGHDRFLPQPSNSSFTYHPFIQCHIV